MCRLDARQIGYVGGGSSLAGTTLLPLFAALSFFRNAIANLSARFTVSVFVLAPGSLSLHEEGAGPPEPSPSLGHPFPVHRRRLEDAQVSLLTVLPQRMHAMTIRQLDHALHHSQTALFPVPGHGWGSAAMRMIVAVRCEVAPEK